MTDPASVLRREVHALIRTQIAISNQTRPQTAVEPADFRAIGEDPRALQGYRLKQTVA